MQEESLDLHAIRQKVTARDKALIGSKPLHEAVKFLKERYGLSQDSASEFVVWQKSLASGGDPNNPSNPSERWHLKFDETSGKWIKVPQPGEPGAEEAE